jgi:hypothetical protein
MKRILVGLLALLTGAVIMTAPAQAMADCGGMTCWSVVTTAQADAAGQCYVNGPSFPTEVNGCKFYTKAVCVDGSAINGTYYRVAAIAQQWNIQGNVELTYQDDCVAAGYTPSRRMVVNTSHGGSAGSCLTWTNTQASVSQGMARWTNGPGAYVNVDNPSCVSGQTRRDHAVSMAIGWLLGASTLNSSGWASRVMYSGNFSLIGTPTAADGGNVYQIYVGSYCTPKFSGC